MGKITLSTNIDPCVTVISNTFLDRYMLKANGEFLKVYLYLLRWAAVPEKDMSVASVADTFNLTERDVKRALKYWAEEGLIKIYGSEAKGNLAITLNPMPCDVVYNMKNFNPDEERELPEIHEYSEDDINGFKDDFDGKDLLFAIEQYIGKPLSKTDIDKIMFFHDELGFSVDLIEYLFEYCLENNHKRMSYIVKVAMSWSENGIDTVAKAKAACKNYSKTYFDVLKAMGVTGRNPIDLEVKYIDKWKDEYGFSADMIKEACKRTVLATGKCNFQYADGILRGWKEKNYVNLKDVTAGDEEFAKKKAAEAEVKTTKAKKGSSKFGDFDQRTYDFSSLEKTMVDKLRNKD